MPGISRYQHPNPSAPTGNGRALRRLLALAALTVALALAVAACGSSGSASGSSSGSSAGSSGAAGTNTTATTGTTHLAKTKFVLHAGLAFGAFHHWIYKPLKAGQLKHPLTHKLTTVKAALASVFVYHELKLALGDAQADPTLSKLVAPITALQHKVNGVGSSLKSGQVSSGLIDQANSTIGSIHSAAAAAGQQITETAPALP